MTEPTTGRDWHAVIRSTLQRELGWIAPDTGLSARLDKYAAALVDALGLHDRPTPPATADTPAIEIIRRQLGAVLGIDPAPSWPLMVQAVIDARLHAHTPPATVDPADLRATIAEAQYLHAGNGVDPTDPLWSGVNWDELTEAERDPWLRDADAVLAALTAAGWPTTYQPDNPHVTAARQARQQLGALRDGLASLGYDIALRDDVSQVRLALELVQRAEAFRLELTEAMDEIFGDDGMLLDRARALVKAEAERDAERALVVRIAAAVDRVSPEDGPAVAHHDIPGAVTDLHQRLDEAQRERDAERDRADQLGREVEQMRRAVSGSSLTMGEALALDANDRLRAEVQAIGDDMAGNAEAFEAEAETPRERHLSATLANFAARLLALHADEG